MVFGDDWDAERMLDLYLHDYLVKKKMHQTAAIFKEEADIWDHKVAIDSPEGFLNDWWSIFYDVHVYKQRKAVEAMKDASFEAVQMNENEQQTNQPMMIVPHLSVNQKMPVNFQIGDDYGKILGLQATSMFPAKVYGQEHFRQSAGVFDPSLPLLDLSKLSPLLSAESTSSHPPQQIFKKAQSQENNNEVLFRRALPVDAKLYDLRNATFPISLPHDAGINAGVKPMTTPMNVLNSHSQAPRKETLMVDHQQALLAQEILHANGKQAHLPAISTKFDSSKEMLLKKSWGNGEQQMSQTTVHLEKSSEHQHLHGQLQQQQQQQYLVNNRKRKAILHPRIGGKILDSEEDEEDTRLMDNIESFLSHDDDNANSTSTPFNDPKGHHNAITKNEHKGFTFDEVIRLHLSKSKVLCCHFSSNGKLLASAGHEKKVSIWNMETFDSVYTSEAHKLLITDVRFKPSSTIFATSSFDKTVKVWDAARANRLVLELVGHEEQVTSLDFHPTTIDLLCSCDVNDEIRLWNFNPSICTRTFKGATKQVRFEPRFGQILATVSGNGINLFDVETGSHQCSLKGHVNDVLSISWDQSGKYIVSISEESARLWSLSSGGKCIHELRANGNKFQSCTFHPTSSNLMVIGGYQLIELWSPFDSSRTLSVPAHKGLVSALAKSEENNMVASASHDSCVKLWKC